MIGNQVIFQNPVIHDNIYDNSFQNTMPSNAYLYVVNALYNYI